MNIRLIHSVIRRPAAKLLAIAAAAAMTAVGGQTATAQSGLEGYLADGGQSTNVATQNAPAQWGQPFAAGTKVVSASAVRTAADVQPGRLAPGAIARAVGKQSDFSSSSVAQVSYGCQSCNQPACSGGCNGYQSGGYGSSGYGESMACGIPCNPYRYAIVEGLYMDRQGLDGFSLTRNASMDEFDFEFGSRITIGSLPNCVNGYEFTFVGPLNFNRSLTVTDPNFFPGSIDSNLFDGDGVSADPNNFDGTFLDPFDNSNSQTQSYDSEYWSGELNKTLVGWDVAKALCGGRVIRVEEDYRYFAEKNQIAAPASYADLSSRTVNTLVGVQGGLDMLYPIAQHLYTDLRGRAGLFYNFAESDVRLRNQGNIVIHNKRDDGEIAGVFEFGAGLRWQLGEMLSIRGGAEVWYITNAATAAGQINNAVTNALGTRINIDDELFYYGVNAGAEIRF